ncbi:hypothetical protein [Nannocystis punicea]|uniref:Uncharacterized protein n=1 Tax=Nannocystis punicea TaxID=2995304 RepID=A0ABY7H9T2_9BACT|nr:hypothetical protein [Nannocystis poenicansa]WAS96030.1 hypothetical protein O0S08_07685 [Nannocystis poenicansa]
MMVIEWSVTTGSPTRINDSGGDGDGLTSGADIFVTGNFGGVGGHSLTVGRLADGGLQGRLWTH